MKIKCIENRVICLPEEIIRNYSTSYSEFSILKGGEYIVYGMTVYLGYIWYYVCDEDYSYYPIWNPSPLFEVVDGRLSRYWTYSYKEGEYAVLRPRWAFLEWTSDPDYYDRLTDGEDREVEIFKNYKELMDLEFPDSSITEVAQIGDDEWLICPSCIDAWQCTNIKDALVKCPKCQKNLNNPRFKNEWPHL
jgi:hypothetical protein